MRSTVSKKVSKMDVEIGKMHRELARLYEERAKLMQKPAFSVKSNTSELDFPEEIIEELINEEKPRMAKKARK